MKTIMIVDNEKSLLEEIKQNLNDDDLQVVTVENNREALELMEQDKENNFELVLINTSMPDSKIPAFFSMKPSKGKNIDTSLEEDFLQKPFTKQQLIDFVKSKIK